MTRDMPPTASAAPTIQTAPTRGREADLARRWAAGEWRGQTLWTERGEPLRLIFEGRRGGGAGPDFRDAVLARLDATRLRGDIELHLHAGAWRTHGHAGDPRYNGVVLHVVLATTLPETRLASGALAPVVVLRSPGCADECGDGAPLTHWPCADLPARHGPGATRDLLLHAGHDRFAQRAAAFGRELAVSEAELMAFVPSWSCADRVLFVALAEGLGYGRDRAALRQAGERLAHGEPPAEVLAEAEGASPWQRVERLRLRGLLALHERWRERGPWSDLRSALLMDVPHRSARVLLGRLTVAGGCVSLGRARILAANVALPFASAYATRSSDDALAARALASYDALAGLPSNQITREMIRQLGLPRLPSGAAAQQGLHHIWAGWCREKRCEVCPCNRSLTTEHTEHTEITEEVREAGGESPRQPRQSDRYGPA